MLEQVYCISLKDDTHRREFMKPQLEKYFEKYQIVDAITCANKEVKEYVMPENHRFSAQSQIAICMSHRKCIQDIYDKKLLFGAIIEDDIHIREDYTEALNRMIKNSPQVIETMKTEPSIIHLVSSPSHTGNKFIFAVFPKVVNICFYVINHMMAKILLENDFIAPFDQHVHFMVNKYKIKEYVATPILGYDISSALYHNYHTDADKELKKFIRNESNNEIIKKV